MEKFSFEDYLEKRYNEQLKYYSSAASKNQKKYNKYQWTLIILSTLTTIMAALPDSLMLFKTIKIEFKYLIVLTSGLVTVITAGLKTFKYEELWVNYRKTAEKLKPHFFFFHMNIGKYGKAGAKKEQVFVETIEEILNQEQAAWLGIKNSANQTSEQVIKEIEAKMEGLLREKFNTLKPVAESVDVEPEATEDQEEVGDVPGIPVPINIEEPVPVEPPAEETEETPVNVEEQDESSPPAEESGDTQETDTESDAGITGNKPSPK